MHNTDTKLSKTITSEQSRAFILENLHLSNKELSSLTGLSERSIKHYLHASNIIRTQEQKDLIMARNGALQAGSNNPNWKNGASSGNYKYKLQQKYKFPEKVLARNKVYHALKTGALIKQPCMVCGDPKSQAHHSDHSKPLEVKWLCPKHHREVEKEEALKKNCSDSRTDVLTLGL